MICVAPTRVSMAARAPRVARVTRAGVRRNILAATANVSTTFVLSMIIRMEHCSSVCKLVDTRYAFYSNYVTYGCHCGSVLQTV